MVSLKIDQKILVSTIKGYLGAVNKHYKDKDYNEPFDASDGSDTSKLLRDQAKFEDTPAKKSPLNEKIVKMYKLDQEDPLDFRAACFHFVVLSCYGGFRQQEFAMDTKKQIKFYVLPDGKMVVCAFTMEKHLLR